MLPNTGYLFLLLGTVPRWCFAWACSVMKFMFFVVPCWILDPVRAAGGFDWSLVCAVRAVQGQQTILNKIPCTKPYASRW